MDNRIYIGDFVKVTYFESVKDIYGKVLHIPQDVGDMWVIETETNVYHINPNCSILVYIDKEIYK